MTAQTPPQHHLVGRNQTALGSELPHVWDQISSCNTYRYQLGHRWADGPLAVFLLCNPSTATAFQSDPTSRACDGFARKWGKAGRIIVNVCALRATDPDELERAGERGVDPCGAFNSAVLVEMFERIAMRAGWLLCLGWGDALPSTFREFGLNAAARAREARVQPMCIGLTKAGQPLHPLMKSHRLPLVPFEGRS